MTARSPAQSTDQAAHYDVLAEVAEAVGTLGALMLVGGFHLRRSPWAWCFLLLAPLGALLMVVGCVGWAGAWVMADRHREATGEGR